MKNGSLSCYIVKKKHYNHRNLGFSVPTHPMWLVCGSVFIRIVPKLQSITTLDPRSYLQYTSLRFKKPKTTKIMLFYNGLRQPPTQKAFFQCRLQ